MTVSELIAELAKRDVRLAVDGDKLTVSAPRGALTAPLAATIRQYKPELLAMLSELGEMAEDEPISAFGDEANGVLSLGQQRLWVMDQMVPDSSEHNLAGLWRLRGPLDVAALRGAMEDFVRRHALLRTTFVQRPAGAWAETHEHPQAKLTCHDLRDLPAAEREAGLQQWYDRIAAERFDLGTEPPFRLHLAQLGADEHALCSVSHAIAWDGWCFDLLLSELGTLYLARLDNKPAELPAATLRYADFALWQRRTQDGDAAKASMEYWQQQLSGSLDRLPLPADQRPTKVSHHGARENFRIGEGVTGQVRSLALQEGATPYMLLLASYALVVGRYADTDDVMVTTPVRGRDRPELESIIGPFTNTLFLRLRLGRGQTFRQLLRQARDVVLEGFSHQRTRVESLLERLDRDLAQTCLFQVDFSYQNTGRRETRWGALEVAHVPHGYHAAHADLVFWLRDSGASLSGALDYRTDLYDAASMRRFIEHFQRVLQRAVAAPDLPLEKLDLMGDDERRDVLEVWSSGPVLAETELAKSGPMETGPAEMGAIVARIEQAAHETPGRIAVVSPSTSLTFRALMDRARGLASRLNALTKHQGEARNARIGIYLEGGSDAVVALLGVLLAGLAVVPLDPRETPQRLYQLQSRLELSALITTAPLMDQPANLPVIVMANVEEETADAGGPSAAPSGASEAALLGASMLATDEPIVALPYSALDAAVQSLMTERWGETRIVQPDAKVLVLHEPSEPVALAVMLTPLVASAQLAMLDADTRADEAALAAFIEDLGASLIEAPARELHMLLALVPSSLRGAVVASCTLDLNEPLVSALQQQGCRVLGRFGSPKTAGLGVTCRYEEERVGDALGAPAPGAELRVLNWHGRACPVGVDGNLHLRAGFAAKAPAHNVAREATEADSPWVPLGIRARWMPGGHLQYRHTPDSLHRVAGVAVDLARLQQALCRLDGVADAFADVVPIEDAPARLLAWITLSHGAQRTHSELRNALAVELPPGLWPDLLVTVDELPRDQRGQVLRRVLRNPLSTLAMVRYDAPRPGVEHELAAIWSQVLGINRISAHDNFFEIGGTSLLALRVIYETETRLSWPFEPRLLFFQTLRQMAERAPEGVAHT